MENKYDKDGKKKTTSSECVCVSIKAKTNIHLSISIYTSVYVCVRFSLHSAK